MPQLKPKARIYDYYLLRLTAVMSALGFFFWLPGSLESLWLRRLFIYGAGLLAIIYVGIHRKSLMMRSIYAWPLIILLVISTYTMLISPNLIRGLIGQPVIHPSLLSLFASIALGLTLAILHKKQQVFEFSYYLISAFAILNLVYWLIHGTSTRLGLLGEQINYSAYLFMVGLVIGAVFWKQLQKRLPGRLLMALQSILFVALLLSQSRTALILSLIVLLYQLTTSVSAKKRLGFVVALLIGTLTIVLSINYFSRLHNYSYLNISRQYRLQLAQSAVPSSTQKLITGGGAGSLEATINQHGQYRPLIKADLDKGWRFESSHNLFIDIMTERGLVVMLMFLWLLGGAIWAGWKSNQADQKMLLAVLVVSVIFLAFNNINIEQEVVVWACILGLLDKPKPLKV